MGNLCYDMLCYLKGNTSARLAAIDVISGISLPERAGDLRYDNERVGGDRLDGIARTDWLSDRQGGTGHDYYSCGSG